MKKIRIILALISDVSVNYEPLGVECLAGHLNNVFGRQLEIKILRICSKQDAGRLIRNVSSFTPDILGLSLDFDSLKYLPAIIPFAAHSGIRVICGNILATFNTELLLRRYPEIIIARGSGELSLAGMVHHVQGRLEIDSVPNIAYARNNAICYTETMPCPIATPDRNYSKAIDFSLQRKLYLEASRGCPHSCAFCAQRLFSNAFRVEREADALESDIRQLCRIFDNPITQLDFVDEDVLANPETAITIASAVSKLKNAKVLNEEVRLMCCLSVRSILMTGADSALRRLVQAGLDRCFIGIESFSNTQLRRLGKGHSREDAINALAILRKMDIKPADIGFIMFDPETTLEDIIINCRSINAEKIIAGISNAFHQWRALPGTQMCKRLIASGLVKKQYDPAWLTHEWVYADHRVAEIVGHAKNLESGLILVESAIKKIYRSEGWYRLPAKKQDFVLNSKQNLNRLFIDFLEAAALVRNQSPSLTAISQQFDAKALQFLTYIIENAGENLQAILQAAKKALKIKKLTTGRSLLLPQDYPKN